MQYRYLHSQIQDYAEMGFNVWPQYLTVTMLPLLIQQKQQHCWGKIMIWIRSRDRINYECAIGTDGWERRFIQCKGLSSGPVSIFLWYSLGLIMWVLPLAQVSMVELHNNSYFTMKIRHNTPCRWNITIRSLIRENKFVINYGSALWIPFRTTKNGNRFKTSHRI